MKCQRCDTENKEGSLFCNKCGAELTEQNNDNRKKEKPNNKLNFIKNKRTVFISTVAIIVIIVFSLLLFLNFNNPVKEYQTKIENSNYSDADNIYNEEIKGDDEKEKQVESFLLDEITEIENSFLDKKIEFSIATDRLEAIENTGLVSKEVKAAITNVKKMNNSRVSYKRAEEFQKEGNYKEAIKEYKDVVQEDENYKNSQKQIEEMTSNFKKDILKQAEESAKSQDYSKSVSLLKEASSIIPNDSDISTKLDVYEKMLEEKNAKEKEEKIKELKANQELVVVSSKVIPDYFEVNDQAQVIVENKTQKVVKSFNIGIVMYDKNGYPLKSGILAGESQLFKGKADSVNIQPGQTFGSNSAWNLYTDYGTINKINACVMSVEYYDGSEWTNEYYRYWEEEHLGKPYK